MKFFVTGLIIESLEDANANSRTGGLETGSLAFFTLSNLWKGIQTMTKQLETVNEVVRNDKHPFRKTDHQPRKALKNRYERRKIKEFLHLTDWLQEEAV